jgi:hypothetical protein
MTSTRPYMTQSIKDRPWIHLARYRTLDFPCDVGPTCQHRCHESRITKQVPNHHNGSLWNQRSEKNMSSQDRIRPHPAMCGHVAQHSSLAQPSRTWHSWRERTVFLFEVSHMSGWWDPAYCYHPTTSVLGKTMLAHRRSRGTVDPHRARWANQARRSSPPQQGCDHRGGLHLSAVNVKVSLLVFRSCSSPNTAAASKNGHCRHRHCLVLPDRSSSGCRRRVGDMVEGSMADHVVHTEFINQI